MGNLLFSGTGRIGRQDFTKGAVILLAINFFLWLAWFVNMGVGSLAALASLVLIYCWGCLFAKRLNDAGKSPAIFIAAFFGFVVLSYILANILALALSPDLAVKAAELQTLSQDDPENIEALIPLMTGLMKALVVPYAVSYFIAGAIVAFGFNAALKSGQ